MHIHHCFPWLRVPVFGKNPSVAAALLLLQFTAEKNLRELLVGVGAVRRAGLSVYHFFAKLILFRFQFAQVAYQFLSCSLTSRTTRLGRSYQHLYAQSRYPLLPEFAKVRLGRQTGADLGWLRRWVGDCARYCALRVFHRRSFESCWNPRTTPRHVCSSERRSTHT